MPLLDGGRFKRILFVHNIISAPALPSNPEILALATHKVRGEISFELKPYLGIINELPSW
jgi:hypothetical protein